jgi:glycolate oxidase iron-sulfur subunit
VDDRALVDYAKSLDCIHCGLCLRTCPTYQLTGSESSSPRGRIYMMRGVAEGRLDAGSGEYAEELDFCLVCRHCESVCPAGVRFGEMMEYARDALATRGRRPIVSRLARWLGFSVVLPSRWLLHLAAGSLRLAQRSGLARKIAPWLGARGAALANLPRVPPARERRALPRVTPARGETRGAVAVLEGCVMPELYGRVNRATVDSLAAHGIACRTAAGHTCCGALHAHNGDLEGARELARLTIACFDRLEDERGAPLPVVVNSAGCGAHMKDFGRLLEHDPKWRDRARAFAARTLDYSEAFAKLAGQGLRLELAPGEILGKVAYDDPCHLCHGQSIRREPRALLDAIRGLERVELPSSESCCGSAGIYALLRPADSAAVLAPKLDELAKSGAKVLVTANPGCQLQWESALARTGSDVRVVHIAELLALASSSASS